MKVDEAFYTKEGKLQETFPCIQQRENTRQVNGKIEIESKGLPHYEDYQCKIIWYTPNKIENHLYWYYCIIQHRKFQHNINICFKQWYFQIVNNCA